MAFLITFSVQGQIEVIETLRAKLSSAENPIDQVDYLLELSLAFEDVNLDSMTSYAERAKEIAMLQNSDALVAESNLCLGIVQWKKGDLNLGLQTIENVYEYSQENDLTTLKSRSLLEKGRIYNYKGEYEEALKASASVLNFAEEQNDLSLIAQSLKSIGGIHFNLSDLDRAKEYWERGLQIALDIKNNSTAASLLNNIGATYKDSISASQAIHYFKMALEKYPNSSCQQVYSSLNIAESYVLIGQYDSAYRYYNQVEKIAKKCDDYVITIAASIGMANLHSAKGEHKTTIQILQRILQSSGSKEYLRERSIVLYELAETYETVEDHRMALHYFKRFNALQDSIISDETSKKIIEIEAENRLEKVKSDQKMILLSKEKEIITQRLLTIIFVIGLVSMILLSWFYYQNFKRNRKANIALKKLNVEIENQKSLVEAQAKELKVLNSDLELKVNERTQELKKRYQELEIKTQKLSEYAFINSHLLRAPLSKIMAISSLLSEGDFTLDQKLNEALISSSNKLDAIIREIAELVSED
ncbi:MAG: hypothetical protein HRT61_11685 [Ekhidna sp.]|nr:hypothetical protein [Ekhidna sp.]